MCNLLGDRENWKGNSKLDDIDIEVSIVKLVEDQFAFVVGCLKL